jgi:quinol monooxygenase YgiN
MSEPIVVFARFLAKAGKEEEMKAALLQAIEPTRAEPDNILYDLHQAVDQPAVFFFHEHWTDEAALQRHMQTPHLKALAAAAEELQLEPFSVVIARMISAPAAEG